MAAADSIFNLIVRVQANTSQAIAGLENLERVHKRVFASMASAQTGFTARGPGPFGAGGMFTGGVGGPSKPSTFAGGKFGLSNAPFAGLPDINDPRYATDQNLLRMKQAQMTLERVGYTATKAGQQVQGVSTNFNTAARSANNFRGGLVHLTLAFGALVTAGSLLSRMGHLVVDPFTKVFKMGMGITATMEDIRARYETLFQTPDGLPDIEKVNEMLRKTRFFAVKTPFEIDDITAAVVQLKGFGIDAFQTFKGIHGEMTNFATVAGDIAATYAGMSLADAVTLVGELRVGAPGAVRRMLTRGIKPMDIRDFGVLHGFKFANEFIDDEGKLIGGTIRKHTEEWEKLMAAFFSDTKGGMMERRAKTMGGIINNIKDAIKQILTVGFGGMPQDLAEGLSIQQLEDFNKKNIFSSIKASLQGVYDSLRKMIGFDLFDPNTGELSPDKWGEFQERLKSISDTFSSIFGPVAFVIDKMAQLVAWTVKFNQEHPKLFKFMVWATAIAGLVMVVGGAFLTFAGFVGMATVGIANLVSVAARFGLIAKLAGVGKVLSNFAIGKGVASIGGKGFAGTFLRGFALIPSILFRTLTGMFTKPLGWIKFILHAFASVLNLLAPKLVAFVAKWALKFAAGGGILTAIYLLFKVFTFKGGMISRLVGNAIEGFVHFFERLAAAIPGMVDNLMKRMVTFFESGRVVEVIENFFAGGESSGFNPLMRMLHSMTTAMPRIIWALIKMGWQLAKALMSGMWQFLSSKDTWINLGKAIIVGIEYALKSGLIHALKFWNMMVGKIPWVGDRMKVDIEAATANLQKGIDHDKASLGIKTAPKFEKEGVNPFEVKETSPATETQVQTQRTEEKNTELMEEIKRQNRELLRQNEHLRKQMIEAAARKGYIEIFLDGKKVGYGVESQRKNENNRSHNSPVDNSNNSFR